MTIRALGPSLSDAGVQNPLADPTLDVRDCNSERVVSNDNWMDDPAKAATVAATGLAPTDEREA